MGVKGFGNPAPGPHAVQAWGSAFLASTWKPCRALTFLRLQGDLGGGRLRAGLALLAALAGQRGVCLQLPVGLGTPKSTIPRRLGTAQL